MALPLDNDMNPAGNEKDSRTHEYNEANDRSTTMTDMDICMKRLGEKRL